MEETEPVPEPVPPPGGWVMPTCTFESHLWAMDIEQGRVSIHCVDPCDQTLFDPSAGLATCSDALWQPEDFTTPDMIMVNLTYIEDSTPSTPAGPAEYGFYIEVRPA